MSQAQDPREYRAAVDRAKNILSCLSAHFVSRTLQGMVGEPRIIHAICMKPFHMGHKNDYNAEGAQGRAVGGLRRWVD